MSADHCSGVREPPSRLRSIRGTTNIYEPAPRWSLEMRGMTALLIPFLAVRLVAAQTHSVASEIARGDSFHVALQPDKALVHYRAALALDSANYGALWKASRATVDVAKQLEGDASALKRRRDSLYVQARALAEAAVRANPNGAQGHSMIAQSLRPLSRT